MSRLFATSVPLSHAATARSRLRLYNTSGSGSTTPISKTVIAALPSLSKTQQGSYRAVRRIRGRNGPRSGRCSARGVRRLLLIHGCGGCGRCYARGVGRLLLIHGCGGGRRCSARGVGRLLLASSESCRVRRRYAGQERGWWSVLGRHVGLLR